MTAWLEYCAEGVRDTLQRVWLRAQQYQSASPQRLILWPRQQRLLELLRDQGSLAPAEIWAALQISRQGAMDLLRPLLDAGLVEKVGGKKTGRYVLRHRMPSAKWFAADARVVEIDLRETTADIRGQEIKTSDKVSLRLNAMISSGGWSEYSPYVTSATVGASRRAKAARNSQSAGRPIAIRTAVDKSVTCQSTRLRSASLRKSE